MNAHYIGSTVHAHEVAQRVCAARQWLVRSEGNVVGPVSLDLLGRGVQAGKIPAAAEMSFLGGTEWRRVGDVYPATATPSVPPPPPSFRYPEAPISIPKQSLMASLFA
jgi:hypothetical protein